MSQNPFGSQSSASLSNNPFIDDASSAHSRYPTLNNINAGGSPLPYGGAASPQYGYQQPVGAYQASQPVFGGGGGGGGGYGQPGFAQPQLQLGLQSTGYFGASIPSPSAYSAPYSPLQYGGPAGPAYGYSYPPQQQQQQPQWAPPQPSNRVAPHLQDLDPYSGLSSQSWAGPAQQQQQQQQQAVPSYAVGGTVGAGAAGPEHPRAWIRAHKDELETWDPTSWRQALVRFAELQTLWERRRDDAQARVDAAQRGIVPPHELPHWQALLRDAGVNVDTVAAARFQMEEALTGYQQSSDLASKRRVKEFINAGLLSLPDFPPPL